MSSERQKREAQLRRDDAFVSEQQSHTIFPNSSPYSNILHPKATPETTYKLEGNLLKMSPNTFDDIDFDHLLKIKLENPLASQKADEQVNLKAPLISKEQLKEVGKEVAGAVVEGVIVALLEEALGHAGAAIRGDGKLKAAVDVVEKTKISAEKNGRSLTAEIALESLGGSDKTKNAAEYLANYSKSSNKMVRISTETAVRTTGRVIGRIAVKTIIDLIRKL